MKFKIEDEVKKKAVDGKITCAVARKIAEDLGVPPKKVGEAANKLKIKIKDCTLGCF
jgi:hypothetical protein